MPDSPAAIPRVAPKAYDYTRGILRLSEPGATGEIVIERWKYGRRRNSGT